MTTETIEIRDRLVRKLSGEYLEGFRFAFEEDETQTVASLTNGAVTKFIALEDGATNLTLRYVQVKNKKTYADTTYKLEVVSTGTDLSFVSTDIATGKVINEIVIPPLVSSESNGDDTCDTIEECLAEFDSSDLQSQLQMEANRTCEDQFTHVTCCLTNGMCYSVVLIIKPWSWRCYRSVALPESPNYKFFSL